MDEDYEDEEAILGVFILIKDSLVEEAVVMEHSDSHHYLLDILDLIISDENTIRKVENERPNTLMESKHPKERHFYTMFEEIEIQNDKEIIRYGDERTIYRIEEL